MNEFLETIIFFSILFIIICLINYFFILKKKYNKIFSQGKNNKKSKKIDIMELSYLIMRFNLDIKKMDILYCLKWITILDAFIIAFTSTIIILIPWKIMGQLLVGFVLIFGLIFSLYEIMGRYLVKKGWQKQ